MRKRTILTMTALVPFLGACEDTAGPEDGARVAVRFDVAGPAGASASRSAESRALLSGARAPITLTGTNGTLVLQDIRFIVSELELKRAGVVCVGEDDDDACEEFEGGPFLVDLLDGRADDVVAGFVPEGLYTELEFEIENLDPDEDDDAAERQAIQNIFTQVRRTFPAFPDEASLVVRGTFDGQPFTVFFDAEIEVEEEFAAPLRVPEQKAILVTLDPAALFKRGNQVVNLLALNGQLVELEAEFETELEGALGVEADDD